MTKRRVVVTGLGCLAPVGNTVSESWANLLAGKSGIDTITKFDVSAFLASSQVSEGLDINSTS